VARPDRLTATGDPDALGAERGPRFVHVLIVDDDPQGRSVLERTLRSANHRVSQAGDGVEALRIARADMPDLVITDVLMPDMDGHELCRAWKASEDLKHVPLAIYTASYTDAEDEAFGLGLGADAYWRGPMSPRELLDAASELVATQKRAAVVQPELTDEPVPLARYSVRLVDLLEAKAARLERANVELHRALGVLAQEMALRERLIGDLNTDMLERERVEEALRQERDFSRQLIEVADLFICVLDTQLRVALFSRGAERMTGHGAAEVVGQAVCPRLVASEHRAELKRAIAMLPDADVARCLIDVLGPAGQRRAVECAVTCTLDGAGVPVSYTMVGVDVTERRRLGQLKSDFIQTVSHELRTPLTSIVGFGDLLAQLPPDRLAEQAPAVVERLRGNTDRMRVLVEELLEVNDIAADGITLSLRPFDLGPVVRRCAEAVFRTSRHILVVEVDPGMPPVVCDAERMCRVVTNLVSNAVKYSPEGGEIEVRVGTDHGQASISVRDHGVGIPCDGLADLFDRFTQADMSSTRAFGGMGLGLYIVDEIVRAHRGSVSVASEPGEGSTFTVRVPLGGP